MNPSLTRTACRAAGEIPLPTRTDADVENRRLEMQRVTDLLWKPPAVPGAALSPSTPWRPQRCRACFTALCRARQRCASAAASHSPAKGVGGASCSPGLREGARRCLRPGLGAQSARTRRGGPAALPQHLRSAAHLGHGWRGEEIPVF